MANRNEKEASRKRILSTCVRLFLEQGFKHTPPKQILTEADVSAGTFYNLYRTKAGVLTELTEFMFQNQFTIAGQIAQGETDPVKLYAVETAIQLTLAELNENLRDVYLEAYTCPDTLTLIHRRTAGELQAAFGAYLPEATAADFLEMEVGTAGMMRAYMACRCTADFPLERKISRFLTMSLRVFRVPEDERARIITHVATLDMYLLARRVMNALFESLSMHFEL